MTQDQLDLLLEARHSGDYGPRSAITNEEARDQISRAESFVQLAENMIGSPPPPVDNKN